MQNREILIACDHAGFELKQQCKAFLLNLGFSVKDLGAHSADSVDYPDFAHALATDLAQGQFGVLICGSGIGISIAANRHANIRCALCHDATTARLAREHNDANVLAMGARIVSPELAQQMIKTFLDTKFEGGRHEKRVCKINL